MKFATMLLAAHATFFNCSSNYYVNAHYSAVAFGKRVASVMVHAGVQESETNPHTGSQRVFWTSIVDKTMMDAGNHFFTKFELSGVRGGGDGNLSLQNLGPVIQYWIKFADGSTVISDIIQVPVTESYGPAHQAEAAAAELLFRAQIDANSTSSFEVYDGSGCPK